MSTLARREILRAAPETLASELLRMREAAAFCNIGESTAWRYLSAGRFPKPIRVGGGALRWRRSDLIAWIEKGCPALKAG
jgi:prophage regulatory protein